MLFLPAVRMDVALPILPLLLWRDTAAEDLLLLLLVLVPLLLAVALLLLRRLAVVLTDATLLLLLLLFLGRLLARLLTPLAPALWVPLIVEDTAEEEQEEEEEEEEGLFVRATEVEAAVFTAATWLGIPVPPERADTTVELEL